MLDRSRARRAHQVLGKEERRRAGPPPRHRLEGPAQQARESARPGAPCRTTSSPAGRSPRGRSRGSCRTRDRASSELTWPASRRIGTESAQHSATPGQGIGRAGAGGRADDAGPARDPRVAVGGEGAGLLVADQGSCGSSPPGRSRRRSWSSASPASRKDATPHGVPGLRPASRRRFSFRNCIKARGGLNQLARGGRTAGSCSTPFSDMMVCSQRSRLPACLHGRSGSGTGRIRMKSKKPPCAGLAREPRRADRAEEGVSAHGHPGFYPGPDRVLLRRGRGRHRRPQGPERLYAGDG